jgi:hypothetical protein
MLNKSALWIAPLLLICAFEVEAKPLPAIEKLQKQRIQVCRDMVKGDLKRLIKNIKKTENFLKDEAKKSSDPARFERLFGQAYTKSAKIYELQAIDRVADVWIYQVYRDALMVLREKYREAIRLERVRVNGTDIDFFENDCAELV